MNPDAPRRESRKVQVTGKATHIVSLPKSWVRAVDLQAGDLLQLVPRHDGCMLLRPPTGRRPEDETTIHVPLEDPEAAWPTFLAAYRAGWPRLNLAMTGGSAVPAVVRGWGDRLVGLQVVDEQGPAISFGVIVDAATFPVERALRRMAAIAEDLLLDDDAFARDELARLHALVTRQANLALDGELEAGDACLHGAALRAAGHLARLGRVAAGAESTRPGLRTAVDALFGDGIARRATPTDHAATADVLDRLWELGAEQASRRARHVPKDVREAIVGP